MVNYLIILFAMTLVYLSVAERFRIYAGLMGIQGVLLFGITLFELQEVNTANLVFIASETLLFKAIVVPFMLIRIIKKTDVYKVHNLAMPGFYQLALTIISLILSLILANAMTNPFVDTIYLTIALFCFFTGMLLIVTEQGFGKRTAVDQYRQQTRGGKGLINLKVTEKTGAVVGLRVVKPEQDLLLINNDGIIIRMDVGQIRVIGRNTQGVALMRMVDNQRIVALAMVDKSGDDAEKSTTVTAPLNTEIPEE